MMSDTKRYKVIDGPLSIRISANGMRTGRTLPLGAEITVTADPETAGNYVWVLHDTGWSALSSDDGDDVFMQDISDVDPNAPRRYRIWAYVLSIRDAANGKRLSTRLYRNAEITVDPKSRTEAGGYIWWKHDAGWSAERSTDGSQVFMKEIFDVPTSNNPITEKEKTKIPAHWKGIMTLQVAANVKVRNEPKIDARGLIIRTIRRGQALQCDMDTLTEADGYYWVRHETGWSAIQSVDGKTVFLAEPGTIKGLVYIGPDGPKAEDLPHYRALFTRLPVSLDDIQWFQYFGNNMFAMRNGARYGYDRYSQGLHGGLDFGNSIRPKPVYAGLEAEFVKVQYPSRNNTRIYLKKDDYTIIYQHITNPRHFNAGDIVTPDMQIGTIEHHSINNGWDHLHLEVRFMKEWIINPLLLFTEEIYNELVGGFDPDKPNSGYKRDFPKSLKNFFYHTDTWSKWITPIDQPMIKLVGPVIGPRAELEQADW